MKLSFLNILKNKKQTFQAKFTPQQQKFINTLKDLKNYLVFENTTIYHRKRELSIPLLILDKNRGLYIIESKDWRYNDLKNSNIQKAHNVETSTNSLSFDNTHNIINQRLNELMNGYEIDIFNFLFMQNLTEKEYEELDISIKELLPKDKIIFCDSTKEENLVKLQKIQLLESPIENKETILGNLFVQYLILDTSNTMQIATNEQQIFINSEIDKHQMLYAEAGSGKSSSILQKAIFEKLKNPTLKIIIIEPTTIASDILKRKLLEIVEHAILDIDISSIEIITPIELLNKHHRKINKHELEVILHVDDKLMRKKFKVADLIICDDSNLIAFEFIAYLKHIQKNSSLILVANQDYNANYKFTKSFRQNREVEFKKTNQYAKALQLISSILETNNARDILVVSDNYSKKRLNDELEFFIEEKVTLLDNENKIVNLNLDNLILSSYTHISGLSSKFVILLDIETTSYNEIEYAVGLAQEKAYILYEDDECENIKNLRIKYNDN